MEPPKKSRVRVQGKLTVVSSTPVGPGRSHPLSSLDHAMANHTVRMVYYYGRASKPDGPAVEFDPVRASLCELLCLYPTLTGRLARDAVGNWQIRFNDAGVRVIRATVGTTLDEWLRSADGQEEKDLTAWDDLPDDPHIWPPFRIQLSEFECGGVAIGVSFTHLLSDPTTITFFLSSLSEFHRRQPLSHPPFIHPHALLGRPSTPLSCFKPPLSSAAAFATATFVFSHDSVRNKLLSVAPNSSPFDLLAALFWTAITQLGSLTICVDFRKRLHAPLPYGYFGNALYFTSLQSDGERELGHVADSIHRHVESIREEDVWSTVDTLESRKDEKGKFGEPYQMYGPELTCVNMEHLISESGPVMYTSEFGDECKPVHVSYDVEGIGEGLIWVMPSPEGGMARRVKVVLPPESLAKVSQDDVITSLGPTLMISGQAQL